MNNTGIDSITIKKDKRSEVLFDTWFELNLLTEQEKKIAARRQSVKNKFWSAVEEYTQVYDKSLQYDEKQSNDDAMVILVKDATDLEEVFKHLIGR